jgi:hypothetical protein
MLARAVERQSQKGQPQGRHTLRRVFLYLFLSTLMLQAIVSVTAKFLLNVPVSTEMDSVKYIRTADNVLAGHGFSIENTPPRNPNAFRTPGPLLINMRVHFY